MAKLSSFRKFEWFRLEGGGELRLRPRGAELGRARDKATAERKRVLGIAPADPLPLTPEGWGHPSIDEAEIGTVYGGFRGFEDEEGRPLSDKDENGELSVEAYHAIMGIDEIQVQYMEITNRLTRERNERLVGAEKNSGGATAGTSGTDALAN